MGGGLNVLSRSWAALDCTDVWDTHIPPMVHESESRVSDTSSVCTCAQSLQSCPTVCDTTDYSPSGSSVHGILQAGILEWVAMPSSRGSSRPRIELASPVFPAPTELPGKPKYKQNIPEKNTKLGAVATSFNQRLSKKILLLLPIFLSSSLKTFFMWTIFKVFIEFVSILLLVYVFVLWP